MSTPHPSRVSPALDDLAAEWLCERAEGFSPARAQAFAEWRDADPLHAAAVRRVERALAMLDGLASVSDAVAAERFGSVAERATPAPRGRLLSFPRIGLAAAAAVMLGAVVWWQLPTRTPAGDLLAAEKAAHRVALRDGSVVDLNAASALRVAFNARERHVALNAGEACFQVAPDTARPFVVTAGDVAVRAVGTAFNVRRTGSAVEVLVFEGKVEVTRGRTRTQLATGDRTRIATDATVPIPQVEKVAPAAIRQALAWQDPLITFNDVPLSEVVLRFNQRNVTQLVLGDEQLGGRRIGGVFILDQVDAFVRLLEQGGDIVAVPGSPNEIVLRRTR